MGGLFIFLLLCQILQRMMQCMRCPDLLSEQQDKGKQQWLEKAKQFHSGSYITSWVTQSQVCNRHRARHWYQVLSHKSCTQSKVDKDLIKTFHNYFLLQVKMKLKSIILHAEGDFDMRASRWVAAFALIVCAEATIAQPGTETYIESNAVQSVQEATVTTLPAVIVKGHYNNAVGTSDAASQGVIRGELLQDIPLLRPGEALETVPGMVVTQHSGDGKANQYFLRGYNLDHGTDFASSVDGVPVNMPTNAHGQGYCDLNFLIPELVDHIDYRKGTYFAENGDFSSAGSADIHYRKSLDHNIADLTIGSFRFERALLAGSTVLTSLGQSANGSAVSSNTGPTLLGAVELEHENGPWITPENLHKINALARLSDGNTANGWSFDGIHYDATWNSTDQVPLELINLGQLGRFSAVDPSDGGESGREIISGEWHSSNAVGYTKVSTYLEHYRLRLWSNFTFDELRPNTGDQFEQEENRNIVGGQVAKGWSHSLLGNGSTTELGLQVRHDNINVVLLNTEARVPFAIVSNDQVSETSTGLYLQNTTTWNSWLRTLVGLREDTASMNMTSYTLPLNSGSASGSKSSPKLSVILGPWAKTEFFISAGKGFHSNDARGVIDKWDPTQPGTLSTPVPVLVSSFGKEIGLRTEVINSLQSSLALWSLNSDSEIVYSADSTIGSTEANGASKRTGVEWNNHWIANRWLLVDADIAWTRTHYADMNANRSAGNLIPNAVSKVARFGATIHDFGPWSAVVEIRYIGSYPLSQDGSLTAPSALVTNLRVGREISQKATVSLDALNLFNRQYYDIAYQQDYAVVRPNINISNPNGITVHPGEPRQLRVTLRLKF